MAKIGDRVKVIASTGDKVAHVFHGRVGVIVSEDTGEPAIYHWNVLIDGSEPPRYPVPFSDDELEVIE